MFPNRLPSPPPRCPDLRRSALASLLAIHCLLCAGAARADRVDDLVGGALAFHDEHSPTAIDGLSGDDLERLREGEIVVSHRVRRAPDGTRHHRVAAFRLTTVPRREVWIAANAPGTAEGNGLRLVSLDRGNDGGTLTWFHFRLPWPLRDRQWITRLWMDHALATASGGRIWTRRWQETEAGQQELIDRIRSGAVEETEMPEFEAAVQLPTYRGSFHTFDLDGVHTLLVILCTVDPGGHIPEAWTTNLVARHLEGTLQRVVEGRAPATEGHARGDFVVHDGFGAVLPPSRLPEPESPEARGTGIAQRDPTPR